MRVQCSQCIMDKSAEEITFDENGVCNFCYQAQEEIRNLKHLTLPEIKGKEYDCLIGLSGGVDSSYTLLKAVEMGLRPLCFSVDNGWNDPKADENIMRLVETLKVPFYRYTIDLKEFRDLQSAFMKAGQKNLEIPTDHVLMATTYEMAAKYNIKWILSGGNVATESIMPPSWGYNARDLAHIKDIFWKIKRKKIRKLPVCSVWKWNWYRWVKGIKTLYLLDYVGYNRAEAIKELERVCGWQDYHEKHCESIFTWWFQNFYLFEKYGIDKRKAHLSSMINSGQITRQEALDIAARNPIYPELGLEQKVMEYPKRPHTDFKTDPWYDRIANFVRVWKS